MIPLCLFLLFFFQSLKSGLFGNVRCTFNINLLWSASLQHGQGPHGILAGLVANILAANGQWSVPIWRGKNYRLLIGQRYSIIRIRQGRMPLPLWLAVLRIRDVYPGSWFLPIPDPGSRIPDQKTATKERGEKKLLSYMFCSHKFHKTENYFVFELLKKKIWANFQRIIELFMQKIVIKLSKIWFWDPGSGKNLFYIPDPGSRGQKGTRSRIPDPQHCWLVSLIKLSQ